MVTEQNTLSGRPENDMCPRTQAAFHVFGMELLAQLDLDATNQFFSAFFRLPQPYWQGFLASRLSSAKLVLFAAATFMVRAWPGFLSLLCSVGCMLHIAVLQQPAGRQHQGSAGLGQALATGCLYEPAPHARALQVQLRLQQLLHACDPGPGQRALC